MSRYLFVVPPFASHVNPTVSIGQELVARGHDVAWVTYAQMRPLLPDGAMLYTIPPGMSESDADELRRQTGAPWFAGMKVLFERVIAPLAEDMLPAVEAAIDHFRPDALVADHQAFAGALAARRHGLRWATSAPSAALLKDVLAGFPAVQAWLAALYANLQRDAGLEPVASPDLSPDLVILYTSRLLAGPHHDFPAHYHFVGPALSRRPEPTDFPWQELGSGPLLFVTLGTLFAEQGQRFFRTLVDSLRSAPVQVIVSTRPDLLTAAPDNFIVRPWVPLTDLLPRVDAVLCHAGTIVNEALVHGIPAVVAPIAHEQSIYAQRVVDAGTAVRVRFNRVSADALRRAVFEVLDDPSFRVAARRIQESFREAGGAAAAASAIEQLR